MIGVEHLVEEGPEGDGGPEDALAEGRAALEAGVVDLLLREVFGEGQSGSLRQVPAGGGDWPKTGARSNMAHRRLPQALFDRATAPVEVTPLTDHRPFGREDPVCAAVAEVEEFLAQAVDP